MLMRMRRWLAPPVFEGDAEKNRVARLVNTILLATAGLISLAALIVVLALRNYVVMGVTFVSLIMPVIGALFILRRGYVRAAALVISLMLWLVLVVMGFLFGGVVNTSFTTLVIIIMIAALLLGGRAGVIFAALSFVAVTVTFISGEVGILPPPLGPNVPINYWITHTINYGIAALLLYLAMGNLTEAIQRAQRLADESEAQREQLQNLVQERTEDLERNANYLHATAAVARATAGMDDPQVLLARVADVVCEQFGFYHIGIYLLDEAGEWAELQAVSGQGRELLEQGFRARIGVEGIIGDVARRGVHRLVADVRQDVAYRRVAELPETRAELVLPLLVRNEIIGVLDVQSTEARAFSEQDVATLQVLADQVAVNISNTRLLAQAQRAIEAERRAYGAVTGQGWQIFLRTARELGFYSTGETIAPAGDLWQPEMKTALHTGRTTTAEQDALRLAAPVKVRGEVIGVIDFSKPADSSAWTSEEITLVETLTEQLGVALESARLYEDTQRRAAREQLTGEVTARIRETLDVNEVLQTATREMRRVLDLAEVEIRMGLDTSETE